MRQRLRQQGAAFREFAKSRRGGGTLTASAALLCAGTLLVAGGSQGGRDPYVAAGPAEQSSAGQHGAHDSKHPVKPSQGVKLVPQPEAGSGGAASPGAGRSPSGQQHTGKQPASPSGEASGQQPGTGGSKGGEGGNSRGGAGTGSGRSGSGAGGQDSGSGNGASPGGGSGDSAGRSGAGHGPAKVRAGKPHRSALDQRWCERVTVTFRNTGGQPATSGRVILGTHIIGALGTDWDTVTAERKLPVPIRPGEQRKKSWKVCVDKWRVPLGMRVDTQDVRAAGPAPDPAEKKNQREKSGTDSGQRSGSRSATQRPGTGQPGTDAVPEPSLSRQPGERSGGLLTTP